MPTTCINSEYHKACKAGLAPARSARKSCPYWKESACPAFSLQKSAIRSFPPNFAELFTRAFLLVFLEIADFNFVRIGFLLLLMRLVRYGLWGRRVIPLHE
jgi:hypothetical protein